MWQLAIDATNASSGSTQAGFEYGGRTTCGEEDAGTVTPPSNDQVCSREYLPSRKPSDDARQLIVEMYSPMPRAWLRAWAMSSGATAGSLLQDRRATLVGGAVAVVVLAVADLVGRLGARDAILVHHAVAVVVETVADLGERRADRAAAFVDLAVAVVVDAVADLGRTADRRAVFV